MVNIGDATNGAKSPSHDLTSWACSLKFADLPPEVVDRTKSLYLDWFGSALAGRDHVSVVSMLKLAKTQGPATGKSKVVGGPGFRTSPLFAALINGASSHVVEQDDLHNSSMMHPATVVFPTALAVAQEVDASGEDFIAACVVGYEFACKSHYKKFHTTATTGIVGAAAAASYLLHHDASTILSAVGTAGTQAAGLLQFLLDATHSKQVHTGKLRLAASDGVLSAYLADSGLLGPSDFLEGDRGMVATLSSGLDSDPSVINNGLGSRWSVMGSSFKWYASCRHTHPSVDALLAVIDSKSIKTQDIESIEAHIYQSAIDILKLSEAAETVHQSKFSMGFVLAVAAVRGSASILDFTEGNPFDGPFKGIATHVLDIALILQNYEDHLPRETATLGRHMAEKFIDFAHGLLEKKGEIDWQQDRHTTVWGPMGQVRNISEKEYDLMERENASELINGLGVDKYIAILELFQFGRRS